MKKQFIPLISVVLTITAVVVFYTGRDFFMGERKATTLVVPPDPDVQILIGNMEAKDSVVADLIAGRITLAEAGGSFQTIDASRPSHLHSFLSIYPGRSDRERMCRQVIAHVNTKLEGRPEHDAVVAGLEADLQKQIAAEPPPLAPVVGPRSSID
jgi:hypothetical protein